MKKFVEFIEKNAKKCKYVLIKWMIWSKKRKNMNLLIQVMIVMSNRKESKWKKGKIRMKNLRNKNRVNKKKRRKKFKKNQKNLFSLQLVL